jgi:hypothetical protein
VEKVLEVVPVLVPRSNEPEVVMVTLPPASDTSHMRAASACWEMLRQAMVAAARDIFICLTARNLLFE